MLRARGCQSRSHCDPATGNDAEQEGRKAARIALNIERPRLTDSFLQPPFSADFRACRTLADAAPPMICILIEFSTNKPWNRGGC